MAMSEVHGYISKEQINDLSRTFSINGGYRPLAQTDKVISLAYEAAEKTIGYDLTPYIPSKGYLIDEIIRKELEEERGVVLKTNRKHIVLQLSFDNQEYFTQKQWNEKIISRLNEVCEQINEKSKHGSANYLIAPAGLCVMDPTKLYSIKPSWMI